MNLYTWASLFQGLTIFVVLFLLFYLRSFHQSVSLTFLNNLDNSIICMTEKCSLNTKYIELNANAFIFWKKKKMPSADLKEKAIEFQNSLGSKWIWFVEPNFLWEKAFTVVSHSKCYRSKWTEIYIGLLFGRNYLDIHTCMYSYHIKLMGAYR